MEQRSFVFPAATALGLTDALDEDDVMWDALFKDSPSHAGHDGTSQAAGATRKGRRGGWRRSFKRTPHASKKYEQNRYDYKESPWWKNFVVNAAEARVPGSRIAVEFHQVFNVPFMVYDALLRRASTSYPGGQLALQGQIRARGEERSPKNPCSVEDHGGALLSEGECHLHRCYSSRSDRGRHSSQLLSQVDRVDYLEDV